jgi:hypothetical protein
VYRPKPKQKIRDPLPIIKEQHTPQWTPMNPDYFNDTDEEEEQHQHTTTTCHTGDGKLATSTKAWGSTG